MGIMYLFDTHQVVRAAIVDGVTEWIHHEKDHTIDVTIPAGYKAENGEYLGFECVDGRWRLFCITDVETDDAADVEYIEALDAAVDDLTYINVQDARQEGVTARQAVETLLNGTEWALGEVTAGGDTYTTDAEWEGLWHALQTVETVCGVRVVPYYTIEGGVITGKRVDVLKKEPVFRGCFLEEKLAPANIKIKRSGRPVTVMYGLGKAMGTGDEAERLTMADAEWSIANGDPEDKPKGQLWVEDAEATAKYGRREQRVLLNDVEDPAELTQKTWEALQENKKPKANVEATFQDLEQLTDEEYRKVRIGDEALVRTRQGELISTTIYDIDRDYVTPELSKVKSGNETDTATSQVAGLIRSTLHTQETLTVYRNKFLHDEALIQLNANTILANAELIRTHAQQITTLVGEVNAQEQLISGVQIDISGLNQSYTILAGTVDQNTGKITGVLESVNGLDQRYTVMAGQISDQGVLLDGVLLDLDGQAGRITALADEIVLKANQADLTLANGRIDANANAIALASQDIVSIQAGVGENAAGITLANSQIAALANDILMKADKIDLQGYVTATQLETSYAKIADLNAVSAQISNLTSGLSTATVLNANVVNGAQVNGTYGSFDTLTHNGALVSQRNITMGSLTTAGKALSTGGSLDLQHSHKVTVGDDGTVTLGEVAAEGGNFKIADTKVYKDGVSAAYGNGYNGGFADGKDAYMPTAITRTGFSTTDRTVTVRALNSHQDLLTGQKIDASEIYDAGYSTGQTAGQNAVTLSKSWSGGILTVKASNGKTSTAQLSKGTETWSGNEVSFPVLDGSGSTGYTINVDASERYKAGWNDFRAGCTNLTNVYTISENSPGTLYMLVNGSYTSVGSSWVKVSKYSYAYKIPSAMS